VVAVSLTTTNSRQEATSMTQRPSSSELRDAALAHAARGWHVFPLIPGIKRPAIKNWETRATTDPDRVAGCWAHGPYNIGIATGPSGLLVVDLDKPKHADDNPPPAWDERGVIDGADVLTLLAADAEQPYPGDTFTVGTPTGGQHLYHRAPGGIALRSTAGKLGWKVDTRGHGGYVVAPASVIDDEPYRVLTDREPADLPAWLLDALRPKATHRTAPPTVHAPGSAGAYAAAALRNEVALVATAPEGGRNATLVRAARALGRFVATGELDRWAVERALKEGASSAGLPDRESAPSITSALDWSITHNTGKAA